VITIKGNVCFLETHSESFEHELVNSEVVHRLLSAVTLDEGNIFFISTQNHAERVCELLPFEITKRINWVHIETPIDSYSFLSIFRIFRILHQYVKLDVSFVFLSAGSADLYASALYEVLNLRKSKVIQFHFVLHGVLSNFDVRKLRPDPYIFRRGRKVIFSFSRYALYFPLALKIISQRIPESKFFVLGSWIKENLIAKLPVLEHRIVTLLLPTPILQRRLRDDFVRPNSLLLLGYNNLGMLDALCQAIHEDNSDVELNIVTSAPNRYSGFDKYDFINLHIDSSRENLLYMARCCNYLLILRSRELRQFQTSGVLLESLSLGIPAIFPDWMKVMTENFPCFPGFTYSNQEDLLQLLLTNDTKLELEYASENHKLRRFQQFVNERFSKRI
jgi:hypothetical protein